MKTKVINLSHMKWGRTSEGYSDKTIDDKMRDVFDENPHYKFVTLIYHPTNCVNMVYASLIVNVKPKKKKK